MASLALLALSLRLAYPPPKTHAAVGVNKLSSGVSNKIDSIVNGYLGTTSKKATRLTLGVVFAGQIVYTKTYAAIGFTADSITDTHPWASVSRPPTT